MNKDKVVIFDFDGVFVDDFDFHKNHIEKFLDTSITDEEFYELHRGNVYKDDNKGLDLGDFDAMKYHKSIRDELIKLPMVDGMPDVADNAQKIAQTFIVSSASEDNIRDFLSDKGVCEKLCTIYGVDTNPSKEKKFEKILTETGVSPDSVIFVTDTLGDILEASSLNIASIAVTWGFQRIDTLAEGAPFGFAHKPGEVTELISEYFSQ